MNDLSGRLAALTPDQRARLSARLGTAGPLPTPTPAPGPVPIAVIGVGCRFPGGGDSPEAFWQRLCEGTDAVRVAPGDRWDAERWYSADTSAPGKTNSRWGGFLDQVDRFDREFFGLSPREAVYMDPQQRLLLETAWEALEDAGQMTDALAGGAVGVFIGAASHSSDYYLMQARHRESLDTYTTTGTAHSILANRLSFLLDLRGPSLAVDTACSSSLVAVHLACQSLRVGECDLAMAGGVNLILTPDLHICLGKLEMMAPDGRCKTFDHRANGFVRGEGSGVAVLKRLPDALRDGDPVLAVILGSAVNQDGASNGLTAPNGPAQQAVVRRALELARVAPGKVGYVETHGTGTALGDPIEVEALSAVLSSGGASGRSCVLGALKTNLGHLEAASGIAGLIKAVLCLKHGAIPPNLHFERLNPHLSLDGTGFVLPAGVQPWPRVAEPRVAGVSSFGFGGTNAHVVLSEAPAGDEPSAGEGARDNPVRLLPISARSAPALRALAGSFVEFLTRGEGATLPPADIAYTASLRRRHHDFRWCVAGSGAADWAAGLQRLLDEESVPSPVIDNAPAGVVFAYSGQGSQWPTMGNQLIKSEPVFREALERCDALFREHAPWSIMDKLAAPVGSSRLDQTEIAQPALFTLQVALTELWRAWGIQPAAVVGHSVGEVAAAYAAGVLDLADAVRVVFHRGRLMQRATGGGRMAAVGLSAEEAGRLIAPCGGRVSIAAINSPYSVVLSGDGALLDGFVNELAGRGVFARLLAVDYAFHSPQMDAYGDELTRSLAGLRVMSPHTRIVSTVSGRVAGPDDFSAGYWARNIRQPVLFADAVRALLADGQRLFVEIGPHPVLCPAIAQCETASGEPVSATPSLRRGSDERLSMLDGLARMQAAGCDIHWQHFFPGNGRCVPLPRYPWQRQRYWLPTPAGEDRPADEPSDAPPPISSEPPPDWFYSLDWQIRGSLTRDASQPSSLEAVDLEEATASLERQAPEVSRECRIGELAGLREPLDALSADYIRAALFPPGMGAPTGSRWRKEGLAGELGLLPRYERLATRLLDILAAAGIVRDDGDHWTVLRPETEHAAPPRSDRLIGQFSAARDILQLHARCGDRLGDVLRGHCDPLSLLFAEDEKSSAEAIYRDAAPSRLGNRLAAEAVREWVAGLPVDRTLRVLEIGAGTGGTTTSLLPLLPADRCEYVFTDLSPLFLQRAAVNFARFPFVRYELLDLERPPAEQGFGDGQFDLIVAANVVHATSDLAVSLDHARRLLAVGGVLLLSECTAPRPWMDITFGLTEGWWRFTDHGRRDVHPLMHEAAWIELLGQRGFADAVALPLQPPSVALFDQALIFARNPAAIDAAPRRRTAAKYLVFADAQGVAEQLKWQIEVRGDLCCLVRPGASFARLGDNEFAASLDRPDDLRQVCEQAGPACDAAVYLADAGADRDGPSAGALAAACQQGLDVVQAFLAAGFSPAGGLWLVTRGSQPVPPSVATSPAQALLWGLGRGVALEAPNLGVRLVDLDPADGPERAATALLAEMDDPGSEDQIALRGETRYVPRLTRAGGLVPPGSPLRVTGTHLVTGGLGGLGARLARLLAEAGANHLVLVVKRPLPERSRWDTLLAGGADFARVKTVRQLEAAGARVTVATLDLTDESALPQWFASQDFAAQPLRGVWHTAMSLSSAPVRELEPGAVRTMIQVKSAAAWRLHTLTRAHPLDHFVLFSSTTALWGATGLVHYAAANTFLDALAHRRRAEGLPATVINWGAWEDLSALSAAERDRTVRSGLRPMPAGAALAALQRVLAAGTCQAVVADIDWSIFKPVYESQRHRPLLERITFSPAAASPARSDGPENGLADRLASAAADERRELLARHVHQLLATVLGMETDGFLDRRTGFFDLGMDSLTSIQLRSRLERDLGRRFPSTLVFTYPTVDALTDYLVGELFPNPRETPAAPAPAPAAPAAVWSDDDTADPDATEDELFDQLAVRLARTNPN